MRISHLNETLLCISDYDAELYVGLQTFVVLIQDLLSSSF